MKHYEGKYLGQQKIVGAKEAVEKTPLGAAIARLETEDGKVYLIPAAMAEKTVTDEPVDPTTYRDKRVTFVAERMIDVITELDVKFSELDFLGAVMVGSLRESLRVAEEVKWGTPEKTVLDVDRVLKQAGVTVEDVIKGKE